LVRAKRKNNNGNKSRQQSNRASQQVPGMFSRRGHLNIGAGRADD
jgi:hypothetical protein